MINSNVLMGVLRHILTIVGGYLAAKFALDANMLDAGISAVVSLVGIVLSVASKTPYEAAASIIVPPTPAPVPAVETAPVAFLGNPMDAIRAVDAPYGYRKDGKPRKTPGRKRKA